MASGCKQCGSPTGWEQYYDEDGYGPYEAPADYCDCCLDIMAERSQKRREWEHYHEGEPCPEIELPQLPTKTPG